MKSFLLIVVISLILGSCTNWKAKFYQSQLDLQECRKAPADTVIIIEPGVIEYPIDSLLRDFNPDVLGEETLTLPAMPVLNYVKEYVYKAEKDSVKIWLWVYNKISDNELRQTIRIHKVEYPREIRTITRTVEVEKPVKDRVNPNVKMIIIGVIILVGGLLALKIINLVTK